MRIKSIIVKFTTLSVKLLLFFLIANGRVFKILNDESVILSAADQLSLQNGGHDEAE